MYFLNARSQTHVNRLYGANTTPRYALYSLNFYSPIAGTKNKLKPQDDDAECVCIMHKREGGSSLSKREARFSNHDYFIIELCEEA